MILTYKTKRLEKLCEDIDYQNELVKKYGSEVTKKLQIRIVQLKAFDCLLDVPTSPPFRRHKLKGNRSNQFAISITNQYRLIFTVDGNNILIDNLKEITCIKIEEVSKHYE